MRAEYKWSSWPPTEDDRERLGWYRMAETLLCNRHEEAFPRAKEWLYTESSRTSLYVAVNFCGLVSRMCADMLFGEALGVGPANHILDLWERNGLQGALWEAAKISSATGDVVLKVRYGKRVGWATEAEPIIEPVHPKMFFPVLNQGDVKNMSAAILAWEFLVDEMRYLRRKIHEPKIIRQELYRIDGGNMVRMDLRSLPCCEELLDEEETGFPGLLVFHVRNEGSVGRFWGASDYQDIAAINDELNNRLSRIGSILDKHSLPKLLLPPGLMKLDERTGRWYVEKEQLEAMEISPDQAGDLPKYLVWDAQLTAAFVELEKLVSFLLATGEVSASALGMDYGGGVAESGRALRFRLMRTMAKIGRKRVGFDRAIKDALWAAQVLHQKHGGGPAPVPVELSWPDGLPSDGTEEMQNEATAVASEISSRRSAIMRLYGLTEEQAVKELQVIREEQPVVESPSSPLG